MATDNLELLTGLLQLDAECGPNTVRYNEAFERIDGALTDLLSVAVPDADLTLNKDLALENMLLDFTGTLTGDHTVYVPDNQKLYLIRNSATGGDITVNILNGTGVVAPTTGWLMVWADGTNVQEIAAGHLENLADTAIASVSSGQMLRWDGTDWANEDTPYLVGGFVAGTPTASQKIGLHVFTDAASFVSGLTGSQGKAITGPSAQTDFDIQKNGSSVGTMRFAASGTVATFIMASAQSFAAGDDLRIIGPVAPNAIEDVSFTLKGTRD